MSPTGKGPNSKRVLEPPLSVRLLLPPPRCLVKRTPLNRLLDKLPVSDKILPPSGRTRLVLVWETNSNKPGAFLLNQRVLELPPAAREHLDSALPLRRLILSALPQRQNRLGAPCNPFLVRTLTRHNSLGSERVCLGQLTHRTQPEVCLENQLSLRPVSEQVRHQRAFLSVLRLPRKPLAFSNQINLCSVKPTLLEPSGQRILSEPQMLELRLLAALLAKQQHRPSGRRSPQLLELR